jgi:hypothetical protein
MNSKRQMVRDGMIAGVLGATTVALWFLLCDFSRGTPLETPALLATTLFHGGAARGSLFVLAAQYTVIHFVAFIVFGTGAAVMLEAAERELSLLAALLILLAVFEGSFVVLVMFLGPQLKPALSWWSVLVGNLLATVAMVGYFFARHPQLGERLFGPWVGVVGEGAAAGAIGGAAVVLWFLLCDLGGPNPFRTPAMLGQVILEGSPNPAAAVVSGPLVMGYTVLHFAVFIAFGVVAACLAAGADDEPLLLLGFILLFCCFEGFFMGFAALLSYALLQQLGWYSIAAGNLLAALAMLVFFYWRHRVLHLRLTTHLPWSRA